MTAYAIAHLRTVDMNDEVLRYIREIDATLDPYDGRFIVHGGGDIKVAEGEWPGNIVIIAFPDRERAEAWYASDAYQEILPLRTENSDSVALIVDGVPEGYRAARLAEQLAA